MPARLPVLRWGLAALLELKAIRRVALVLAPGVATPALDLEAADLARLLRVDGGEEIIERKTMAKEAAIDAFEAQAAQARPWV